MTRIHEMTGQDYLAYEQDMFGAAEQTFDAWVISMEHDQAAIDGWRDLEAFVEHVDQHMKRVYVALDGVILWSATYVYSDVLMIWQESYYEDFDDLTVASMEFVLKESGIYKQEYGWRYNEFTDAYEVPSWVVI